MLPCHLKRALLKNERDAWALEYVQCAAVDKLRNAHGQERHYWFEAQRPRLGLELLYDGQAHAMEHKVSDLLC